MSTVASYERLARNDLEGDAQRFGQWLADDCQVGYTPLPDIRDEGWLKNTSIAGLQRVVMSDVIKPELRCAAQDELMQRYLQASEPLIRQIAANYAD